MNYFQNWGSLGEFGKTHHGCASLLESPLVSRRGYKTNAANEGEMSAYCTGLVLTAQLKYVSTA